MAGAPTEEALVAAWSDVPVGTEVDVTMDDGSVRRTKTRSVAQMLNNHSAVVWLEGISGCYSLSRVRKVAVLKEPWSS